MDVKPVQICVCDIITSYQAYQVFPPIGRDAVANLPLEYYIHQCLPKSSNVYLIFIKNKFQHTDVIIDRKYVNTSKLVGHASRYRCFIVSVLNAPHAVNAACAVFDVDMKL
jgi:hypothetical protein